jgi:uncharacterized protein (TIGR03000 family)
VSREAPTRDLSVEKEDPMRLNLTLRPMTLALLLAAGSFMVVAYAMGQESKPLSPGDASFLLQGDDKKPGEPPNLPPGDAKKGPPAKLDPAAPPAPPPVPPGYLPATVNVNCLPNTTIWIEGQKMTSTGSVRSFQSPPLEPNKVFYYSFKVSWPTAPGQRDSLIEQEVTVRAGQTTVLDFRPQIPVQPPVYSRPIFREGSGRR